MTVSAGHSVPGDGLSGHGLRGRQLQGGEQAGGQPQGRADRLVADTLELLLGRWCLDRRLTDRRAGVTGRFTGEGQFVPAPGTGRRAGGGAATEDAASRCCAELRYAEHGELLFGDYAGTASRALIYRGRPDGSADVRFGDGREFYRLDLGSGCWQAGHSCGRDHYAVSWRVLAENLLREHWTATGPGKDYETVTTLSRLPGSGRLAP
jgi:hypothetical protein